MSKVLIVGGAGYIGSVLTRMLLDRGHSVTVFDRLLFGADSLAAMHSHPDFKLVIGDVRDISALANVIPGQDAVILLAALVGEPACNRDPAETVQVNWLGSLAVAETARYYQVPRLLFASTDSCYGIQEGILTEDSPLQPISLYAELKKKLEERLLAMNSAEFMVTILRLATVYGLSLRMRFDLIINILTLHAVLDHRIKIFGGLQWRPLVHVADAALGFITALEAPAELIQGQVFNIGSNDQNYQIGRLGELVANTIPGIAIDTIEQPPDLRDYHVNFDKAARMLGFKPVWSVADGIRQIETALRTGEIADPLAARYRNA